MSFDYDLRVIENHDLDTALATDGPMFGVPSAAALSLPLSSLVDWKELFSHEPRAEDWLLEPLIPRRRQTAIFSPAKSGKSLAMLDFAARLATGQPVLDRPEGDPIGVLYLDYEMMIDDLHERLVDMGYSSSSDLSRLAYHQLPNLPPMDTEEGGVALEELADHHDADLVILDTTSRVVEGEENSSDTFRAFYRHTGSRLKSAGRTLVRLDHSGKDASKGARGSSAKNDDVDLVWSLTASGGSLKFRSTFRRQSWVPDSLSMVRLLDPLRHELAADSWPDGTANMACLLDQLSVPLDVGREKAREALTSNGHKATNAVLGAALKYRRGRRTE